MLDPNLKLAFVGAGNMASAIIGGVIEGGHLPTAIFASDPSDKHRSALSDRLKIRTLGDNSEAVTGARVIILAVKPQHAESACRSFASQIDAHAIVVSIAAGLPLERLRTWLNGHQKLVRCMPNTPAQIGLGASGLFASAGVTRDEREIVSAIFNGVGRSHWVEREDLIDAVTAVSGSGPAYFYLMIEAVTQAGVAQGLDANLAESLALDTALGAASLAAHPESPAVAELRRQVTSPGGTTAAALDIFEQRDLRSIVRDAMQACADRARELAKT